METFPVTDGRKIKSTSSIAFDALPVEVLYEICSYLVDSHSLVRGGSITQSWIPRTHLPKSFAYDAYIAKDTDVELDWSLQHVAPGNHLNHLTQVSKYFHDIVEGFSRGLLLEWDYSQRACGNGARIGVPRPSSSQWLDILNHYVTYQCVWCGERTPGRALLANSFGCCEQCDKQHWPGKINVRHARDRYKLLAREIFSIHDRPGGLPVPRFGAMWYRRPGTSGFTAISVCKEDMERLAKAVHGSKKPSFFRPRGKKIEFSRTYQLRSHLTGAVSKSRNSKDSPKAREV